MSLFPAFETLPFLAEGVSFVVGQGSLGMGTSRSKIHGIWVFCKALFPLLFGGAPIVWDLLIEVFLCSKVHLVHEVLAVLVDSTFDPIFQVLVVSGWFKGYHRFL